MSSLSPTLRRRLAGLLLILPLMLGLALAAYKFGPSPARPVEQIAAAPAIDSRKTEPLQPANSQLLQLFGMYQTAIGNGRVAMTPAEYLNSLEALYRQRGYIKIEQHNPQSVKKKKTEKGVRRQAVAIKFFQRDESDGIGNLSATGDDADFNSNQPAPESYTFSTLVVPAENGGANWASYRIGIDRNKLAQLSDLEHGDFPGNDPQDVPRLPGLQRIYALSSGTGSIAIYKSKQTSHTALMLGYIDEMRRRGWRLDQEATTAANRVAAGVMCFTQGTRSCLIWVTPGKETGDTHVTISSH